jgi:hypothetical protein
VVKVWTAIVIWPEGESEEIDVEAETKMEAERKVEAILLEDYLPGWQIIDIAVRPPGMSYP